MIKTVDTVCRRCGRLIYFAVFLFDSPGRRLAKFSVSLSGAHPTLQAGFTSLLADREDLRVWRGAAGLELINSRSQLMRAEAFFGNKYKLQDRPRLVVPLQTTELFTILI